MGSLSFTFVSYRTRISACSTMNTRAMMNRSNLPLPLRSDKISTFKGPRKVLGDITGVQSNVVTRLGMGKVENKITAVKEIEKIVDEEIEDMEVDQDVEVSGSSLPPGVADIDSKDADNPQLCSEYAVETFAYLRELEGRELLGEDHLKGQSTNDKMRGVLIDWLVEVQSQFKLLQETLHSTVDVIDRYMAVDGKSVSRSKLQLVGVSAMFLAAKIEEMYAPACSDFVYITDGAYSEAEIKATELKIVRALNFSLSQPISLNFLRRYSKAGDVDILQHSLAKFCLETCLLDYSLVAVAWSRKATASLCLSLLVLDPTTNTLSTVWSPTLAYYSGYTIEDLLPVVKKIANNLVKSRASKLQAVRGKYKSGKFMRVSELPELKGDVIVGLANSVARL